MIGFDHQGLIYEGRGLYGRGLWPSPVVTIATHIADHDSYQAIPASNDLMHAKLVFREDSFDPVTRIRRGRFYCSADFNPAHWHVHPHAFLPSQALTEIDLTTFFPWPANINLGREIGQQMIALGVLDSHTIWRVVDIEQISTGDYLVTLRARNSLGLLPALQSGAVPELGLARIASLMEKVSEAAYRAGPESVIDRCRDCAQACIGLWFADRTGAESSQHSDLSLLLTAVEKEFASNPPTVLISAGRIIARLHARKPNEQLKRAVRGNVEGDAEAALANLGLLLREIGWARD